MMMAAASLSHEDLIAELPKLGQLSASERKKLNDERRERQLQHWRARTTGPLEVEEEPRRVMVHPQKRRRAANPRFEAGTVLLNCAALGDCEGVRQLLREGVPATVYNVDRLTPLHQACLENDEEIAALLIEAGCDLDSPDNELWTPLHAAASCSNEECVLLLLTHNASQLTPNVDGQLPIDMCEDSDILKIMRQDLAQRGIGEAELALARTGQETRFFNEVRALVERGSCPNQPVVDGGATLLHVAAANNYVEVALYLLSKSCKVDVPDRDGWTALHAAAFWANVDIIELLAAHGADFKLRTFCGELPADLTEDEDIRNLLQRLSERSELMRKQPAGAVLRPSSVRGRLVSRMTVGEKEDKRRESAELHSIFVEQIEQEIATAPDSWRTRHGKYTRPSARDLFFPESNNREQVQANADQHSMNLGLSRSDSSEGTGGEQSGGKELAAISEGSEMKKPEQISKVLALDSRAVDSTEDSTDTFDFVSQYTVLYGDEEEDEEENIHLEINMAAETASYTTEKQQLLSHSQSEQRKKEALRKEKSVDDLRATPQEVYQVGCREEGNPSLSRSVSLCQGKSSGSNVKRFLSLRNPTETMQEVPPPRFSPKPRNPKTAYKNRKKAGSSASKQSSITDEDTVTNSYPSSGDNSHLVSMTSPKEATSVEIEATKPTVPPPQPPSRSQGPAVAPVEENSNSVPEHSMATNAGSLDAPSQTPADQEPTEERAKERKSKKCCVIL